MPFLGESPPPHPPDARARPLFLFFAAVVDTTASPLGTQKKSSDGEKVRKSAVHGLNQQLYCLNLEGSLFQRYFGSFLELKERVNICKGSEKPSYNLTEECRVEGSRVWCHPHQQTIIPMVQ